MKQNTSNTNSQMLFNYFNENEIFSYIESHAAVLDHVINIKTNSIRSAIHECIDKGYFKYTSDGVYSLSRTDANGETLTCLLINGDNRDLSMFEDSSVDAIITDRPEYLNRFNIDLFLESKPSPYIFNSKDYKEKERILKPGRFIVELMPQRDLGDYEKVCKIKTAARKGGFDYFSNLIWTKKLPDIDQSLGKEKIMLFSKGALREFYLSSFLKNNDKAEETALPTVFGYGKVYQYDSPHEVVAQILQFISADNPDFDKNKYLNQEAAIDKSFKVVDGMVIEKSPDKYRQLSDTITTLKEINIATNNLKVAINVAIDALEAFYEGPEAFKVFERHQLYFGMPLKNAVKELNKLPEFKNDKLRVAVVAAIKVLNKETEYPDLHMRSEKYWEVRRKSPGTLECSARGDRRFSSSHVKLKIHGEEKTIEDWFISSTRNKFDKAVSRGEPYEYVIDPFTGDKLFSPAEIEDMYIGLWISYLSLNPHLVEYASRFSNFTDSKYSITIPIKTSDIIAAYVKDKDRYISKIKAGKWYKNMRSKKNVSLDRKIDAAAGHQKYDRNNTNKEQDFVSSL